MKSGKRMGLWGGAIALGLLFAGDTLLAVEFKSGEQVVIEAEQVVEDDLYMTGDTMIIKGRVRGDLVATGRVVRIEGTVEGDLVAAAQVVEIRGEILDDVRIAGMMLKLASGASVGDDLFAAGFSFESEPGSHVGGKTGLTGYQALLAGDHKQGLEANLVGLRIEGEIRGNVDARVESAAGSAWWTRFMQSPIPLPSVSPGLTLGSGATIDGNLDYLSGDPASIATGAVIRGTSHQRQPAALPESRPTPMEWAGAAVRRFVVLFLVGTTLFWFAPVKTAEISDLLKIRPLASFGWGMVTIFAFPVGMILIMVLTLVLTMAFGLLTLKAAAAGILVIGAVTEILVAANFWIAVFFLAPAIVGLAVGQKLLSLLRGPASSRYGSLTCGLAVLVLASLIPFAGLFVACLVAIVGLGAASLWMVGSLKNFDS